MRTDSRAFVAALPRLALAAGWLLACGSDPQPQIQVGGHAGQAAGGSGGLSGGASQSGMGGASSGAAGASGGSDVGVAGLGGAGGSAGGGGALLPFKCPDGVFPMPDVGDSQQVCQGFQFNHPFNEGPTWVGGAFYFSNFVQGAQGGDLSGDIVKYTPGGDCEIFIEGAGTNGLAAAKNGNLLGARHETRSITEFDIVTKQPTILSDMFMGSMLDSPNDLVQHSNGGIYFTNPTHELGGRPQGVGPAIFRRDPAGMLSTLSEGNPQPNGITLSPAEDRLYVVNGGLWDLDANGVPSNRRDFPLQADGLGMDCAGNVYLSGGTIRNPDGVQIGQFSGGTNLAFGGPDGKTILVVVGGTGVKIMQTNVPGLP
ncbi:MAG TPA: SMP-30/gluconolactonase/LRE family protein [Polyangiaceae bacterium]|nr:SMP-30/gluconolactonase/LRE family protein [Polyangiaceae bacterium]